jgi:hypothetical protein
MINFEFTTYVPVKKTVFSEEFTIVIQLAESEDKECVRFGYSNNKKAQSASTAIKKFLGKRRMNDYGVTQRGENVFVFKTNIEK